MNEDEWLGAFVAVWDKDCIMYVSSTADLNVICDKNPCAVKARTKRFGFADIYNASVSTSTILRKRMKCTAAVLEAKHIPTLVIANQDTPPSEDTGGMCSSNGCTKAVEFECYMCSKSYCSWKCHNTDDTECMFNQEDEDYYFLNVSGAE